MAPFTRSHSAHNLVQAALLVAHTAAGAAAQYAAAAPAAVAPAAAAPVAAAPAAPAAPAAAGYPQATYAGAAATGDAYSAGQTSSYDYYSTTTTTPPPPLPTVFIPGTLRYDQDKQYSKSNQTLKMAPWSPTGSLACRPRFEVPPAPTMATDLNGIALDPVCFMGPGPHHVFLIGDWGGVSAHPGVPPQPADHRSKMFPSHHREFVVGADDVAQQNVAKQMIKRAPISKPEYILNVGDNFYWGGVQIQCGAPLYRCSDATGQWKRVFEDVYTGPGLDGKQWLGVLGNHDFGGFMMTNGWDQAVAYTWFEHPGRQGRWLTPALYWKATARYPDFAMDYFFVDTNVFDAFEPHADQHHNICSIDHNPKNASCGLMGPIDVYECPKWFKKLWNAQVQWLQTGLTASRAEWQIVVTHFPPEHGKDDWQRLVGPYGIDMILVGHRHQQEVHAQDSEGNFLRPTAYVVSGGGGGITSEATPTAEGKDDQYGFVDLTVSRAEIMVEAISHGGQIRSTTCVTPRMMGSYTVQKASPSLCDGKPSGPQPMPETADSAFEGSSGGLGGITIIAADGAAPGAMPGATNFL